MKCGGSFILSLVDSGARVEGVKIWKRAYGAWSERLWGCMLRLEVTMASNHDVLNTIY